MNITVTIKDPCCENIIQIDRLQQIKAGLDILQETGKTAYMGKPTFYKSEALGMIVSAYLSFEDLGIYSGDILSVIEGVKTNE